MEQIILTIIMLVLLFIISRTFTRAPFAYGNIILMGCVIYIVALLLDDSYELPVRVLTVPLCLLSLFICISNVVLLMREGFRLHNFLGFIFLGTYLAAINILWYHFEAAPEILTPFVKFIRLFVCYLESTILAIWMMGFAVLQVKPEYDKDYVIILGCSISKKGKLRPLIKGRVNRAIHFVWEQEWNEEKTAYYVPSGGQGSDEPMSEGSAMELYLLSHGAEEEEVLPEKRSRNTRENIAFSKKIIEDKKKDAKVAIVTNNYHVLRSGMIARSEKVNAQMIGSTTKWYFWPNAFFRETVAILMMHIWVHIAAAVACALLLFIL